MTINSLDNYILERNLKISKHFMKLPVGDNS